MEEQDPAKSKLDALQKEIYGRTYENSVPSTSQHFSEPEKNVEHAWPQPPPPPPVAPDADLQPRKKSLFKKMLIGVIIFVVLSAGVLAYMFFAGWNVISANNVDISFTGPVTASAGDQLDFGITLTNQNASAITNAVLYIDYPDGTKKATDITEDLIHDKLIIGDIGARNATTTSIHAVLFGELNAERTIKVTLEYGLKNSNASYKKENTYNLTISSTPLTIIIDHPSEIISNTPIDFNLTITSNSSAPLTNVLVKADYPFGFSLSHATPAPSFENNFWLIPILKPGETKNIVVSGIVQGEQNDQRVFHFSIGTQDPENQKVIATRFLTQTESVLVQKPPLAVSLLLNGSSTPNLSTVQGDRISASVEITNNLTTRIYNPEVQVVFDGQLYDPAGVFTGSGFFQSNTRSLVWNRSNTSSLESLNPGEKKTFSFSFSTLPPSKISVKNGTMHLTATVKGAQTETADSPQLTSNVGSTIQTKTSIGLLSRVVYSSGTFRNKGPLPPKVGAKTTYTVVWTATNSSNDVQGAEVHATLPSYIRYLSSNPVSEPVTWNQDKNEVVWRIGDLSAGTGFGKQARAVSFQIEFTPSLSQVGENPLLLSNTIMTAIDTFTNANLTTSVNDLTTRLSSEPQYTGSEAIVTK